MLCRPCLLHRAVLRPSISKFRLPVREYTSIKSQRDPVIQPSSGNHHDLQSYLDYAKKIGLKETSTVYQGTVYEYVVQAALRRLHFTLTRIGQKGDDGIDLIGTWRVPSYAAPLRVFVQCKASMVPVGPQHVRELDGTFPFLPEGWRGSGVIGLLASRKRVSRTVRISLQRSERPMAFLNVRVDGTIREFVWNAAAVQQGLDGLNISQRFLKGRTDGRVHKEIALKWNGIVMPYAKDEKGDVAGMLSRPQKEGLVASAHEVIEHVKDKVRVRQVIARIEERRLQELKDDVPKEKQRFRVDQQNRLSLKPWRESRIGGFPNYVPAPPLMKRRRGRPYKIEVDEFGFPTKL